MTKPDTRFRTFLKSIITTIFNIIKNTPKALSDKETRIFFTVGSLFFLLFTFSIIGVPFFIGFGISLIILFYIFYLIWVLIQLDE